LKESEAKRQHMHLELERDRSKWAMERDSLEDERRDMKGVIE